ncbi:MAG: SocA family protein [Proteobacteria bacterium]|nr:SocA family protein [Pseudomonadota bacterium]
MELNRNRLLNAAVFFSSNTKYCGKIKLFKLLYLLDFEHFKATGRSVTGADYSAWKFGPVPDQMNEEWEHPEEDFDAALEIVPEKVIDFVRETVRPKVHFDDKEFTPRQLALLERLSAEHRDSRAPEMIDVTHAENGAWAKVWRGGTGRNQHIPYELAVADDDPNREAILNRSKADRDHLAAVQYVGY